MVQGYAEFRIISGFNHINIGVLVRITKVD